ncbi:MAG: class A beta-lactamase-related serine hydrolase [Elusimicrobia bacterium]|nr:class A beta-lactamase-related serine hydrolase [Elusimicrobiota bacterium]
MKRIRSLVLFTCVSLSLSMAASASALTGEEIDSFLKKLAVKVDMTKANVSLVDLTDQADPVRGGYFDRDIVPVASVIKLTLLAGAYRAAKEDGLSFDQLITINKKNYTGTWFPDNDPYPSMKPGQQWKVRDVVEVMVRRSDNIATNTLIDLLNRNVVNDFMKKLGLENTGIRHKLSSGADVQDPEATGWNSMPPYDAATILSLIASEKLVSANASKVMYATLSGQMDTELIKEALPAEASYAGKTGELSAARNDAAIIKAPGRTYILVIFVRLPNSGAKPIIHAITKEVDAFIKAHHPPVAGDI